MTDAVKGQARTARDGKQRRASHSMESVIAEAVALLDEAGESALTFRALAARLGGGVGSIYWYVSSKEELLDRASDRVLSDVLAQTEGVGHGPDPIDDLRTIAVALFDAIAVRPWLGSYFMHDTSLQPNAMKVYERMGQQIMRLDLTTQQMFYAVSALGSLVIGVAADMGKEPPPEVKDGSIARDDYVAAIAAEWEALDADEFPFVHRILGEFGTHDDREQFLAGLELLLEGLRLQAERS